MGNTQSINHICDEILKTAITYEDEYRKVVHIIEEYEIKSDATLDGFGFIFDGDYDPPREFYFTINLSDILMDDRYTILPEEEGVKLKQDYTKYKRSLKTAEKKLRTSFDTISESIKQK